MKAYIKNSDIYYDGEIYIKSGALYEYIKCFHGSTDTTMDGGAVTVDSTTLPCFKLKNEHYSSVGLLTGTKRNNGLAVAIETIYSLITHYTETTVTDDIIYNSEKDMFVHLYGSDLKSSYDYWLSLINGDTLPFVCTVNSLRYLFLSEEGLDRLRDTLKRTKGSLSGMDVITLASLRPRVHVFTKQMNVQEAVHIPTPTENMLMAMASEHLGYVLEEDTEISKHYEVANRMINSLNKEDKLFDSGLMSLYDLFMVMFGVTDINIFNDWVNTFGKNGVKSIYHDLLFKQSAMKELKDLVAKKGFAYPVTATYVLDFINTMPPCRRRESLLVDYNTRVKDVTWNRYLEDHVGNSPISVIYLSVLQSSSFINIITSTTPIETTVNDKGIDVSKIHVLAYTDKPIPLPSKLFSFIKDYDENEEGWFTINTKHMRKLKTILNMCPNINYDPV